jgi:hypothetical protein
MPDPQSADRRRIPRPVPVHPLLFAAYPALFLYSQNLGEVAADDVLPALLVLVAGALVALVALSLVFRDPRRAAIVVSVVAIAFLAYGFVDRGLPSFVPVSVQQVGWIALIVASIVVAVRIRDRLPAVTTALNAMSLILVALTLIEIVPHVAATMGTARVDESPVASGAAATTAPTTKPRDIYYIVLDRYGSAKAIDLDYQIVDNDMYGWLADRGFTVAANSHANYVKTSLSLASTLRMDFLDDIAARMGKTNDDQGPIDAVLQDHPVGRFLQARGYRYIHIGSYFGPTRTSRIADVNLHIGSVSDFSTALYDYSALPAIARRLGLAASDPLRERHRATAIFDFGALERVRDEAGPKFVFAHLLMPHPPYVFKADGSFVAENPPTGGPTYATQLVYTNTRLKAILGPLLALPEADRPIIVIQADEGPYPTAYARDTIHYDWTTASADELETKYGILNAMYLPGLEAGKTLPYPTISSVNTFRLVFDDYFDANLPLLPDRSFTSRGKFQPYDLTDITDRLPTLTP